MRNLKLLTAICTFLIGGLNLAHAQTDVTSTYLVNPSFETLKASDGTTDVTVKTKLTNGLYGWTIATLSDYQVESQKSGSVTGFPVSGDNRFIVPSDGTYYYFNRQGWGNKNTTLSTTTKTDVAIGFYYFEFDYKAADYSNSNDASKNGTAMGITVKDASSNVLASLPATKRAYSITNGSSNPGNDAYMNTSPWIKMGIAFQVTSPSALTFEIQQDMKNNGRSDIAYDNFKLYKIDEFDTDIDFSGYIANYGFDAGNDNGWTTTTTFTNWSANAVSNGNKQQWNGNFSCSQVLTDLPNGKYKLSVQGFYRPGNNGADLTAQNAILFAGESSSQPLQYVSSEAKAEKDDLNGFTTAYGDLGYVPNSQADANKAFVSGAYNNDLVFTLANNAVTVGTKKETLIGNDWTVFDNFKLTLVSPAIQYFAEEFPVDCNLAAGKWYYYEVAIANDYKFTTADLSKVVFTQDGSLNASDASNTLTANPTAIQALTAGKVYLKASEEITLTIAPNTYTYNIGDATLSVEDGKYTQEKTLTLMFDKASTDEPDCNFSIIDADKIKVNGAKATASLEDKVLTITLADNLTASTDYNVSIAAGAVGFNADNTNAAISFTVKTPALFDGMYFIATTDGSKYISRGGDSNTEATIDNFGIAANFTTDENNVTHITFIDNNKNLFGGSSSIYTDKNETDLGNNAPRARWTVAAVDGGYSLHSIQWDKYIGAGTGAESGVEAAVYADAAYTWKLEETSAHPAKMAALKDANAAAIGISGVTTVEALKTALASSTYEAKIINKTNTSIGEKYEGYGDVISNISLNNLENGIYKISVSAFQRITNYEKTYEYSLIGADNTTAYIYANGEKIQLYSPISAPRNQAYPDAGWNPNYEKEGNYYPNNQDAAGTAYDEGKYLNEVFVKVTDGTLNYGVYSPANYKNGNWISYRDLTVTYYKNLDEFYNHAVEIINNGENVDLTSLIGNPSFEKDPVNEQLVTGGWINEGVGIQYQKNNGFDGYRDGDWFAERWANNVAIGAFKTYQTLAPLPAGIYEVSVVATFNGKGASLLVNDATMPITEASTYKLVTQIEDKGSITLGVQGIEPTGSWFKCDNFKLTYVGTDFPAYTLVTGKMNADISAAQTTADENFKANKTAENYNALLSAIAAAETSKNAYATAGEILPKMQTIVDATNVYTADALATYYTTPKAKFDDNTLTTEEASALVDPTLVTGWKANSPSVSAFLMSAWDNELNDWEGFHVNTWSAASDFGETGFAVPLLEYWVGSGNLADKTMTATLTGVEAGNYKVSAEMFIKASAAPAGISLQVGDASEAAVNGTANGDFYTATAAAYGKVDTDGQLTVKLAIAGTNASWIAFRNVKYEKVNVDYAELNAAIASAKATNAKITNGVKSLTDAITVAEALLSSANQDVIDEGTSTLLDAISEAELVIEARLNLAGVTKKANALNAFVEADLSEAITAAEEYVINAEATREEANSKATALTNNFSNWQPVQLTNSNFDTTPNNTLNPDGSTTFGGTLSTATSNPDNTKDFAENTGSHAYLYEVTGWTQYSKFNSTASQGTTSEYGTAMPDKGYSTNSTTPPATDMFGSSEGAALHLSAGWGDQARYQQTVENLPSGRYVFYYEIINQYNQTGIVSNYIGVNGASDDFYGISNTFVYSDLKTIEQGVWKAQAFEFNVKKTANINFSVGVTTSNGSSNDGAKVWVDNIYVYRIGDVAVTDDDAEAIIAEVAALDEAVYNAEDKSALVAAKTAFEDNRSIDNYNALEAAINTAKNSVEVYKAINTALTNVEGWTTNANTVTAPMQAKYTNGTYSDETTAADIYAEYQAAEIAVLADTEATDFTSAIINPSFETGDMTGWSAENRTDTGVKENSNETYKISNGVDGSYIFNSWGGSAENNVYQTIKNLPEGTYQLSALLAGFNGENLVLAANEETNSVTVDGNKTTGYTVNVVFTLDAAADVIIKASNTKNPEGGNDASFIKADNFTIKAYSDPLAALKEQLASLQVEAKAALENDEYANVTGEERTTLTQLSTLVPEETEEAYNTAISSITTAISAFTTAKSDYDALAVAKLTEVPELTYAKAEKKTALESAIGATATSAEDAATKTAAITTALRAYYESNALAEGIAGAVDITDRLTNANNPSNVNGWVITNTIGDCKMRTMSSEPYTNSDGTTATGYFDTNSWGSAFTSTFTQDVNLPAGTYILSVKARGNGTTTYQVTANEEFTDITPIGNSGGVFGRGWNDYTVEFTVVNSGSVTVGMNLVTGSNANWLSFGNFRLVQLEMNTEKLASEWNDLCKLIAPLLNDPTYENVKGVERNALVDALNADPKSGDDYITAKDVLNAAKEVFIAAKPNYDILAAEIVKAMGLGMNQTDVDVYQADDETTQEDVVATKVNPLKVAEYEYVSTTYSNAVELGTWNASEGTGTMTSQHWDGTNTSSYLEQSGANYSAEKWDISYDQDLMLPAGNYIFKVAGRRANSDKVMMELVVKNTADNNVLGTVNDFPKGDVGLGINTSGATDFTTGEGHTYANNGAGRGWEWRYVKFTLVEPGTVNVAVIASATAKSQWVGFCNATVQTDEADNVAIMEALVALNNAKNAEALTKIDYNLGSGAFQYNEEVNNSLWNVYETAKGNVDNFTLTAESTSEGIYNLIGILNQAKADYQAIELNAPNDNQLFNIVNNSDGYNHKGKAVTFKSAKDADLNGNTTSMGYNELPGSIYPQAVKFTRVDGVKDGYTISYTRADGNVVYVGTGSSTTLGKNHDQLRPTIDASKAVTVQVIATKTDGVWNLYNTLAKKNIGANNADDQGFFTAGNFNSMTIQEAVDNEVALNIKVENQYGTFILPFDAELPSGVVAYSVSETQGSELVLETVNSFKANTPYIVYAENGLTETKLAGLGSAYTDATFTEGLLNGVYVPTLAPVGSYVMQKLNGKVGFFKVVEGEENAITVPANRAYLEVPSSSRPTYILFDNVTTGVSAIEALTSGEALIFDANGVQQPRLVKGLNIIRTKDGKTRKVMVK